MIYRLSTEQPNIASDAWVADNATVIGKVTLRSAVSVWFNVVIRGDMDEISIGARSNVQDGAVLHTDHGFPLLVGEGVTIGHKVMLHGCTIGDYALIGINAVILNGAKIGANSIVGANALITENMEIPPRSLVVGSPGRVIRQIGDEEVQLLQESAQHYVDNAVEYRSSLQPVTITAD